MKKLAMVLLLVVAGCRRQVVVASPPATGGTGGASPREAVQRFMAAAKAQDLQALGLVWGTVEGPALRDRESDENRATREQREIVMNCYLKHDSYRVLGEAPAANSERVLTLELTFKDLTRSTNFYAVRGPSDRWYVRQFDPEPLRDICAKR